MLPFLVPLLAGAGIGAVTNKDPIKGALMGGAMGAATGGLGGLFGGAAEAAGTGATSGLFGGTGGAAASPVASGSVTATALPPMTSSQPLSGLLAGSDFAAGAGSVPLTGTEPATGLFGNLIDPKKPGASAANIADLAAQAGVFDSDPPPPVQGAGIPSRQTDLSGLIRYQRPQVSGADRLAQQRASRRQMGFY